MGGDARLPNAHGFGGCGKTHRDTSDKDARQ